MIPRRLFLALPAALAAATLALPGAAHHGYMKWDRENLVIIEGWVSKEMDGFPHWEIDVRVDGEDWEVDLGDRFQMEKAGLKGDGSDFKMRREIRVEGYVPEEGETRRMLPVRIILDGDKIFPLEVKE